MTRRRRAVVALACLALCFTAFAPAPGVRHAAARPPAPVDVIFSITDSGLRGPSSVPAGHVVLKLNNHGTRPHQIGLVQLPRGRNARQELDSMLARGQLPRGLAPAGGVGPVLAGKTGAVLLRLPPGQFIVYCVLNAADGRPFYMHGMAMTLETTGAGTSTLVYEDATAGILVTNGRWRFGNTTLRGTRRVMYEGRGRMTEVIRGPQSVQLENNGDPTHAFVMMRADDPTAMSSYVAWLDGRGPAPDIVTGIPNLPPAGSREYLRLNLEQGAHIIFCPNYHARTGLRGFQTGEFTEFIVR